MSVFDTISGYVTPHVSNPRLSTPEPVGVPRWTEGDVNKDIALNSLNQILSNAIQTTSGQSASRIGALTLPELNLSNTAQVIEARREAAPATQNAPGLNTSAGAPHGSRGSASSGMDKNFADALARANAAMKAAGLGEFKIVSGWRSYDQQVALYKQKPGLAAKPGTSWHETGRAVDINWSQLNKSQRAWLEANLPRFGINAPGGMTGNFHKNKEGWHFQWYGGAA